jgi:hypothetical protein
MKTTIKFTAAGLITDQFQHSIAAQGIQGPPDQLIAAGHAACDNWGQPGALYSVRQGLQGQLGISPDQAAGVMWAGVHGARPMAHRQADNKSTHALKRELSGPARGWDFV